MRNRHLFVIVSVLVILVSASAFGAEAPVEREILEICGRRIELMTGDEVKAFGLTWIDVPDDQNAATYYIQGANALYALEQTGEWNALDAWWDQREYIIANKWTDDANDLAAALDLAGPALDLFRKGASMERCQLPYRHADMLMSAIFGAFPGSVCRRATFLLVAEARRLGANGRFDEAIDNYVTVIRIGSDLGRGNSILYSLIGSACIAIADRAAFNGVYRNEYDRKMLERLLRELDALRPGLPDAAHAYRGEKIGTLDVIDYLMRGNQSIVGSITSMGDVPERFPLEARAQRILFPDRTIKSDIAAFFDKTIAAARKPYYTEEARKSFLAECKPWWGFLAQMILSDHNSARAWLERGKAEVDLLRLAVALKLHQEDTNTYPERLDALVREKYLAELPVDPFSGKSFVYKLKDGDFVLYSVGEDLTDNGGDIGDGFDSEAADYGVTSDLPPIEPFLPETETE